MDKRVILGSIAALGLAGPALAQDGFSYSYVELGYVNTEIDDPDIDGDGFGLRGSLEVAPNLHVFTEYSDLEFDGNVDGSTFELGGGLNWALAPNVDLIGTLSYVRAELDPPGPGDLDDDGFALGLGLRGRVTDQIELTGRIEYVDLDDGGDDTGFGAGVRYYFTRQLAVGLDVDLDDDATAWMIGARYDFGQ